VGWLLQEDGFTMSANDRTALLDAAEVIIRHRKTT
jgi:hypothetical protein